MHKDQQRLQDVFLPQIAARIVATDAGAERDCTILNRLFIQGPDPLFLMHAAPAVFSRLCGLLEVPVATGSQAIENAHWQGPGVLLDGTGLDPAKLSADSIADVPLAYRLEALWLLLAAYSNCVEDGYTPQTTMLDRIQKAATAILDFGDLGEEKPETLMRLACVQAEVFLDETPWRTDPLFGKPLADGDHSFYVGYKLGHPCVAATSGALTFYGTIPGTTLAEQGVTVDKELSPQFGIMFKKG